MNLPIPTSVAALLLAMAACAQTPPDLPALAGRLRGVTHYSWTTSTELSGAPIRISTVTGTMDSSGFAVLSLEGGPGMVVAKGTNRVVKEASGWRRAGPAEASARGEILDLLGTPIPADDLDGLLPKLTGVRSEGPDSVSGAIPSEMARSVLQSSMIGRTPRGVSPGMESATGRVQVWLRDGVPERFVVVVEATLSLPFGTRSVRYTRSTRMRDFGTTRQDVPMDARRLLERPPQTP